MKKLLCFIFLFLILFSGCAEKQQSFSSPYEPVLTVDGEVLLEARDILFAKTWEKQMAESLKKRAPKDDEIFICLAEQALTAFYAEQYGSGADRAQVEADYELYISDITIQDADYKCMQAVKKEMSISDEEFKELFISRSYRKECARSLVEDITEIYTSIIDPAAMEENILIELYELEGERNIEINFNGFEEHIFNYESLLLL